jgi:hypothetical protein
LNLFDERLDASHNWAELRNLETASLHIGSFHALWERAGSMTEMYRPRCDGMVFELIKHLSLGALLVIQAPIAAAQTPQELWKSSIAEQNSHYSQVPHAMLKIQDAVYLSDGETAALQGRRDQPASWRWTKSSVASDILRISLKNKKIIVVRFGKAADPSSIEKGLSLEKDIDVVGQPTQVGAGIPGWRVFLYNQKNPAAKNFAGVSYYPYDAAFRVTAQFVADPALPPRVFRTSRGTDKQFYHAGDAVFLLKGNKVTLPFYAESNERAEITEMSAFFTDGLTGRGTYGAGRYVDVDQFGPYPPNSVVIDFNVTYNPNCARSPYFTCPVAIDIIPVSVSAGERDPHAAH